MSTTITTALPPSVLRVADLGTHGLATALDLAAAMKERPHHWRKALRGETVACYFINALTDDHHPCQALADLLTMQERFGDLRGLKLAYVGDGNNVAHSLLEACALAGMHIAIAAPAERMPNPDVVAWAHAAATQSGGSVALTTDPAEAVDGAHAVYTDVWVSMGEEAEAERKQAELSAYQVDAALMARARPGAVFLHCLPAHRGQEVAAEVIDGLQSAVWQQAFNRLPTEQALLSLLTGRTEER